MPDLQKMSPTQFCGAAILIGVQGVNCYTKPKAYHSRFIVRNLIFRILESIKEVTSTFILVQIMDTTSIF